MFGLVEWLENAVCEVGQQWRVGVEWARSVCTGDPPDLCYDKTAKYSGVLQVAILYIYMYIGAAKDKKISLPLRVRKSADVVLYVGKSGKSMYDVWKLLSFGALKPCG